YYLLVHGLALAGFAVTTGLLLQQTEVTNRLPTFWLVTWLAFGVGTGLSWFACLVPPPQWGSVCRHGWGIAGTAIGVGVATWCLGRLLLGSWETLGQGTLSLAASLLRLVSHEVVCQPDEFLLGTPGFIVEISPACSGYEGMALIAAFVTLYLWL